MLVVMVLAPPVLAILDQDRPGSLIKMLPSMRIASRRMAVAVANVVMADIGIVSGVLVSKATKSFSSSSGRAAPGRIP